MKKRFKFLTRIGASLMIGTVIALSLAGVIASAEEGAAADTAKTIDNISVNDTESTAVPCAITTQEVNTEGAAIEDGGSEKGVENGIDATESDNIFDDIYALITENSASILSGATLILSIALTIVYRKGMMPTLEGGIRTLASGVRGIAESASNIKLDTDDLSKTVAKRLESYERSLSDIADAISELQDKLSEKEKGALSNEALGSVMLAQVDMLYEIFISSELPQFLKESVGDRIAEMRRTVTVRGESNEEP